MRRFGLALVFLALASSSAFAVNFNTTASSAQLAGLLLFADRCRYQQSAGRAQCRERSAPASLTKIMTGYVVEEEIDAADSGTDEPVQISVNAWRTGGSKMFIREGTNVEVSQLLKGVIIQSGNDASVALAEHVAGNEDQFADLMNQQAQFLNMNDTQFRNATGLPNEQHYSTAWDLALLTRALIKNHPQAICALSKRATPTTTLNNLIVIGCSGGSFGRWG